MQSTPGLANLHRESDFRCRGLLDCTVEWSAAAIVKDRDR